MAGRDENRVFVGGLSTRTKAHHLAEAFGHFGTVVETEIAMDRKTGRLRGFGFITFTNSHDASAAIHHMHMTELHGHTITVSRAYSRPSFNNEYNCHHGDGGSSNKYYNSTSCNYGTDKNNSSFFTPFEGCYTGNEGMSSSYPKTHKDCHDGHNGVNGQNRSKRNNRNYFPPNSDRCGKNRNNSCFNCGLTGHWARDCTYPRDSEFDNYYTGYHGGPKFSNNPFFDSDCATQRKHNDGNKGGKKCFKCGRTGHLARDCLNQRYDSPSDPHGKRPVSPDAFDFKDYNQLDFDDVTLYCDNCEDFGHFIFECPNLGCCSKAHPEHCDCDGGPYLSEDRFDGSCIRCGGRSLWSAYGFPNSSSREHGESSHGPRFSGKRHSGRPKGYYDGQYEYSSGMANFSNSKKKNSRIFDLFGDPFDEDGFFDGHDFLNSLHHDAFEEEDFFEEGGFKNHGQYGNSYGRATMPNKVHMGGERSSGRQNCGRKNDQFDHIDEDENGGEFYEGGSKNHGQYGNSYGRINMPHRVHMRGEGSGSRQNSGRQYDQIDEDKNGQEFYEGREVHNQNARGRSRPSGPRTSSRQPTGGSSRRPRSGAQGGGSSVRRDSRDDVNERRRHGKDPINVFIFVERGERS